MRTICPSTVRDTCWMRPAPPQPGHVVGAVPGAAPLPPHAWHVLATRTPTSRVVPVTASARSISTWAATSGPRAGPAGPPAACPKSASPKKAAKTSERLPKSASIGAYPPLRRPAWPNRSYVRRRSGSDSTSYASATARNRCSGVGVLADVRVELARELPERPLDLVVARVAPDAEQGVVVVLGRRHQE